MDPFTSTALALGGLGVQGWWQGQNDRAARDWQEYAMQRRHQWEAADLKAAGLNPILSAGGTPSGISASNGSAAPDVTGAISSAWMRNKMEAEQENLLQDTATKKALEGVYNSQKNVNDETFSGLSISNTTKQIEQDLRNRELIAAIRKMEAEEPNVKENTAWTNFLRTDKGPADIANIRSEIGKRGFDKLMSSVSTPAQANYVYEQTQRERFRNVGEAIEAQIDQEGLGDVSRLLERFRSLIGFAGSARQADLSDDVPAVGSSTKKRTGFRGSSIRR